MKVLIVDDHEVVREGVGRLIASMKGAQVLEAATSAEAVNVMRKEAPDVVVLDINLSGSSGLELLHRLKTEQKSVKVVMFTMYSDANYASRALRAGALGYVSKSAPAEELITAIERAMRGECYVEHELANEIAAGHTTAADPLQALTNRETEILRLLGEGKSFTQIADTFGIAYKTVANSCSRLKEKLGLERTADLIRLSVERNLKRDGGLEK